MPTFRNILLYLVTATLPLCAQNGEINGTVTDSSGAVVAGASITITNTATNAARRVQTNTTGNYTVPFLAPGIYTVQAQQLGFKIATQRGLELQVGAVIEAHRGAAAERPQLSAVDRAEPKRHS